MFTSEIRVRASDLDHVVGQDILVANDRTETPGIAGAVPKLQYPGPAPAVKRALPKGTICFSHGTSSTPGMYSPKASRRTLS